MAGKPKNLLGQKFGRLTPIEMLDKRINKSVVQKCKCDCGKECEVSAASLTSNRTKSCGCLKIEKDHEPTGNVKDDLGNKYGHLTTKARKEMAEITDKFL